jgi:branched-chain amino acid transport system substrate-binding protein
MDEFWSVAGAAGDGTIFTGRRDTGLRPGELPAGLEAPGPGGRPSSLATYAAIQVWAEAVRRAGRVGSSALTQALRRGGFETVIGRVAFDEKGDLRGGDWQWQEWRDGRQELLTPAQQRAG